MIRVYMLYLFCYDLDMRLWVFDNVYLKDFNYPKTLSIQQNITFQVEIVEILDRICDKNLDQYGLILDEKGKVIHMCKCGVESGCVTLTNYLTKLASTCVEAWQSICMWMCKCSFSVPVPRYCCDA